MKTAEEIAQWVIDNRYPKNENNKISDSELYHELTDKIKEFASQDKWVSVETLPEEGVEVIGYSKDWIHPDFNQEGTRVCFIDAFGWHSAKWDNDQDSWHTHSEEFCKHSEKNDFNPTHWQLKPLPPNPKEK